MMFSRLFTINLIFIVLVKSIEYEYGNNENKAK